MPIEYKLITAGAFAGKSRMKLHYVEIDTDQVLCGSHLSGYETQPREGIRVCKRCEAAYRKRGGTLLEPIDTDAWLADAYPGLMEDFIEVILEKPSFIKEGPLVENIIGRWSADQLYAPGAMEDIEVVFSPTGNGWLYFNHPFEQIVERFKWEIDNSGLIQINGVASAAFYDAEMAKEYELENYEGRDSDFEFLDLKVEITIESTPRGESEVISFSEPLWLTDRRFALVQRDIKSLEPPFFL
ncbi:hypothetical protein [Paenibacillus lignilyticus]|uniref:Uncharacterized protein n=1 Tax=Paenibacillus lignilyticus TaxID=1172615 RepID=A0ABS5CKZ5_9BACL|nr:hypothetical protein [Paenibacillus lignilyticus]MBP3966539.1 hypothetical protein [Paenibacillus lignilyticus]